MYVATVQGLPAKPMSGTLPCQFAAHQRHGVDDVFEFLPRIRHGELGDIRGAAHRPLEFGAFAGLEFQSQIHGMRNGENVRKQDGGVERVSIDRLQA